MVTRKHVKIANVLTIAFGVMTTVSLALFIAGIWPVWNIFANAFAMNSLGLLSHVLTNVILHRETYAHMRTNATASHIGFETIRKALAFPDYMSKLRVSYLTTEATGMFISLMRAEKSPMKEDTHAYTFRLGAHYDGNPVFVSVPVSISNPCKKVAGLEPKQILGLMDEITQATKKLVVALIKEREYDKFEFDDKLTVDILPAENK